jgi:hypothetical protein
MLSFCCCGGDDSSKCTHAPTGEQQLVDRKGTKMLSHHVAKGGNRFWGSFSSLIRFKIAVVAASKALQTSA